MTCKPSNKKKRAKNVISFKKKSKATSLNPNNVKHFAKYAHGLILNCVGPGDSHLGLKTENRERRTKGYRTLD